MLLNTPFSSKPLRLKGSAGMTTPACRSRSPLLSVPHKQRGVVLFFALIALLAMSLAAVALVRSVDTNTLIAGNLAFKQSAATSGDAGIEQAINWLKAQNVNGNVLTNIAHPLNNTNLVLIPGYHSDSALDPAAEATWNDPQNHFLPTTDPQTGNTVRYLIQRMCRSPNALPAQAENNVMVPPQTNCLFLTTALTLGDLGIKGYDDTCKKTDPDCNQNSQVPVYRITAKVDGLKGTVSYIQALAY